MNSNKADAPNAAMTLQFHFQQHWRGVGDLRRSGDKMKPTLIFVLALTVWAAASAAEQQSEDLTRAAAIEVWDQRMSDLHAKPVIITDASAVAAVASAIQNAPGKWKRGSFTAPSGYLSFLFRRDSKVIGVIGLGERFLVRGGGGDWESKKINKELEATIAAFAKDRSPNKPAPANRVMIPQFRLSRSWRPVAEPER